MKFYRNIHSSMSSSKENPNILDFEPAKLSKLEKVLNENSSWQRLLDVMPPLYANRNLTLAIDNDKYKPGLSEARIFLQRLGGQGVCVSTLIKWLEAVNFQKALILLKEDEPLEIIEQPASELIVSEGCKLSLTCRARSFPSPSYSWFRKCENVEEELLCQQDPQLIIEEAGCQDTGVYVCRVHKINLKDRAVSCEFSNESFVIVKQSCTAVKSVKMKDDCSINSEMCNNLAITRNKASKDWLSEKNIREHQAQKSDDIEIKSQPVNPGEIAQGTPVVLRCIAESSQKLNYQWFCNKQEMEGANFPELHLELFPKDGKMSWEYECLVSNDSCSVLSRTVSVVLRPADKTTQHYAEEKIALVFVNDTYDHFPSLKLPPDDGATISNLLKLMNFKVFAFRNLKYDEMMNAVEIFAGSLNPNSYALYYYAGHGFEYCGQTYAQPVDCSSESHVDECLCTEYVLQRMHEQNTALNVILFDSCRHKLHDDDRSEERSRFVNYDANLAHTVYGYSTSFMNSCLEDIDDSNGFFMKYLKNYLTERRMKIEEILNMVQHDCGSNPLLLNKQECNLRYGYTEFRTLWDEVRKSKESVFDQHFSWINTAYPVFDDFYAETSGPIEVTFLLEFHLHKESFCNGLDVYLCFIIQEDDSENDINNIRKLELDLRVLNNNVEVQSRPESENSKYKTCIYLQGVTEILNIQNVTENLEIEVCLRERLTKRILFVTQVVPNRLSQLDIFKNIRASNVTEHSSNKPYLQNLL